ncbi:MAG TPA: hypothetical protein VGE01_13585, partial [Fimbriimonas sp.]
MRRLLFLLPLLLLAACARVNVGTEIRPDGSFQRKVVFSMTESKGAGPAQKIEDVFKVPSPGPGLQVARATKDEETEITVTRTVKAGTKVAKDAVILAGKKPQFENEASVTALGDGRWLYSERLRWMGEKPPADMDPSDEFRVLIKKALPPTADTATIDRVTRKASTGIWRVLFGPGDPMLSLLFLHPSLAERRFRQRVAASVDGALVAEGVPEERRRAAMLELAKEADVRKILDPKQEAEKQSAKPEGSSGPGLVPMLFTVKVPGEVLETN